jgi:hypothetical protein
VLAECAAHQRQSRHCPDQRQNTGDGEGGVETASCGNDIAGGLKRIAGTLIDRPRRLEDRPDRDRLAVRFEEFKRSA